MTAPVREQPRSGNAAPAAAVTASNGITWRSYYYAGSTRVAVRTQTPTTNVVYFLLGDHLGSTSVVATSSGVEHSRQLYTPWGESRWTSGSLPTDLRYTGQRSEEAGLGSLYDYGARMYSPRVGRFLSADTIVPSPGNPQSLNRYSYVLNNPVKYTDPTGHYAFEEDPDDPVSYGTNVRSKYIRTHPEYDERDITGEEILFDAAAPLWTSGGVVGSIAAVEGVPIGVAAARDALYKVAVQLSAACLLNDFCARVMYGVAPNSSGSGSPQQLVRGQTTEAQMLQQLNLSKNTTTVTGYVGGQPVNTVPDALTTTQVIEIKDRAELSLSPQLQAQMEYAARNGLQYVLHVRPNTRIYQPVIDAVQAIGGQIIRDVK